jgi:hypothetical protein
LLKDDSGQILRRVIVFGVTFAIVILIVVEVGPLIWERFSVAQMADDMAAAAANNYRIYKNEQEAIDEVASKLRLGGFTDEEIRECGVYFLPTTGQKVSVKVVLVKYADTLVTKHINALKKYSKITASHEAGLTEAR